MQKTNLVPAIEERTVSGSSVSFNSAFALPLKKCEVAFFATQSGTPSINDEKPIIPVRYINITANGSLEVIDLLDNRFGGYFDTDKIILEYGKLTFDGSETWTYRSASDSVFRTINTMKSGKNQNGMSNYFSVASDYSAGIQFGYNNQAIYVNELTSLGITGGAEGFRTFASQHNIDVIYPLATPIEISLSDIPILSSIIGNNTFSTDTGTLEITFADLQEKTASGSVATFNTALAMPLASCNIAVNAYQEGTGDPSPVNVRNIVPYNKLRINMVDFNQLVQNGNFVYDSNWSRAGGVVIDSVAQNKCIVKATANISGNARIYQAVNMLNSHIYIAFATITPTENKTNYVTFYFSSGTSQDVAVSTRTTLSRIIKMSTDTTDFRLYLNRNSVMVEDDTVIVENVMIFDLTQMFGSNVANYLYDLETQTAGAGVSLFKQIFYKDYYAYNAGGTWVSVASVNGDNYPDYVEVAFGQDVYGGVLDVVNGVLTIDYAKVVFNGTQQLQSANFRPASDSSAWIFKAIELPNFIPVGYSVVGDFKCDKLKPRTYDYLYSTDTGHGESVALFYNNTNGSVVMRISDTTLRTEEAINAYLEENPITVVYKLATPITIQLTPTQIETIIGNNTIFADTGDTSLTFKDLDIAKRGNFREVFKLPS